MEIGWTKTVSPKADYDAASGGNKRRNTRGLMRHEDAVLRQQQRNQMQSGLHDLTRNLSIVSWACRRHLDYNTQFSLHSQSGIESFDDEFDAFFAEVSLADKFSVNGRYDFDSYVRLLEAAAIIAGDCGTVKIASGHVQAVESDRIRNPELLTSPDWINGVLTDDYDRHLAYGVYRRGNGGQGYLFDRVVPSENFLLHAYYGRFDQHRGVSPIASAANDFQDLYEAKDLMLAKLKVSQLFALAITREGNAALSDEEQEYGG